MNKLLAPMFVLLAAVATYAVMAVPYFAATAHAQVTADAGAGSGSAAAAPADQLHDPLAAPAATFDDLKAAKKIGWGVLALAVLVVASRLLGRLGGVFKFLSTGKASLGIASVGAFAMTAYNAMLLGGSWMASLMAAVVAAAAAWDAAAKPAPDPQKSAA